MKKVKINWDLSLKTICNGEEILLSPSEALYDECLDLEKEYNINIKKVSDDDLYYLLTKKLNLPDSIEIEDVYESYLKDFNLFYDFILSDVSNGFIPSSYECNKICYYV